MAPIDRIYTITRFNRTIRYNLTTTLKPLREHVILTIPAHTFGGLLDIRRLINMTDRSQYDKVIVRSSSINFTMKLK